MVSYYYGMEKFINELQSLCTMDHKYVVEEIDIIRSFDNGEKNAKNEKRFKQYLEAERLYSKDGRVNEIAEALNLNKSTVYQWLVKKVKPYPVRAVEYLDSKGLLPLTYDNKNFKEINTLASWTYWSGTISRGDTNQKKVSISTNPERILKLAQLVEKLEVGYDFGAERDVLLISEGGSSIGRLFYCMGLPTGKKSRLEDITLPKYVKNKECTSESTKDFLKTLFQARCVINGGRTNRRIHLFTSGKKETAVRFSKEVISLIEQVSPGMKYRTSIEKTLRGTFTPTIYVGQDAYRSVIN